MRSSWESNSAKSKKRKKFHQLQKSKKKNLIPLKNETRKEPIASEPPAIMDTIVITKIDTVYIEAPVVEVKEKN